MQAATAYLEALQQLQPPMTAQSRWEELAAAAALPDAPEFAVLSDIKRELVFKTYVDALAKAERVARTQALAAFQVGLGWAAYCAVLLLTVVGGAASLPASQRERLSACTLRPGSATETACPALVCCLLCLFCCRSCWSRQGWGQTASSPSLWRLTPATLATTP